MKKLLGFLFSVILFFALFYFAFFWKTAMWGMMLAIGASGELVILFFFSIFKLTNSEYKEELKEKKFWYGAALGTIVVFLLVCGMILLHYFNVFRFL